LVYVQHSISGYDFRHNRRSRPADGQAGTKVYAVPMSTPNDEPIENDVEGDRRYRAPALEKGLDILELLAGEGAPMSLSEIATALDRSPGELFRMVQVLEFKGYLAPKPTGEGYVLTNKLFALGMAQAPTHTLLEAALPAMRALTDRIGQSCHLAVASNDQMVVVARIEAPGDIGFSVRIGYRRGLAAATSGLVLFAFQPEKVREAWLARFFADAPPAKRRDFVKRADALREQGYLRAPSDFVQGVVDLSAPVIEGDGVSAALTVPFIHRMPLFCTMEDAIPHLRATVVQISESLGQHA
jgi:DNA-binding IclR family transcriptional regulator